MHSGAGRISRLLMRAMSFYESGDSNSTISLLELFRGNIDISSQTEMDIEDILNKRNYFDEHSRNIPFLYDTKKYRFFICL